MVGDALHLNCVGQFLSLILSKTTHFFLYPIVNSNGLIDKHQMFKNFT